MADKEQHIRSLCKDHRTAWWADHGLPRSAVQGGGTHSKLIGASRSQATNADRCVPGRGGGVECTVRYTLVGAVLQHLIAVCAATTPRPVGNGRPRQPDMVVCGVEDRRRCDRHTQ